MHWRRPSIKQEKPTSEERLAEEQRLKEDAEGMKRTLKGAEGMPLAEIFGSEERPCERDPLVGQPNSKLVLLHEKIVLAASFVVSILLVLALFALIGTG
jgi:hypothetical protein